MERLPYELTLEDKRTGELFDKGFATYEEMRKFAIKCAYGHHLIIRGFIAYEGWQNREIGYWADRTE